MQIQTRTVTTIPGYRIYEYLLVLSPPKELWEKIMEVKAKFADDYKSDHARLARPQVLLANFVQYEMMQERLVNRLRIVAMGATPFKIELRDFGSFPSHTIYINVVTKVQVQNLVKAVRHESQKLMKLNDDNKPHFILEPHLTIARKLEPWQYEKGWLEYSNKSFTGRFIVDNMVLLRRPVGEMKYQIVQKFEFQNMPVMTKQGELFM
jgi:2'-5' RNA ligase